MDTAHITKYDGFAFVLICRSKRRNRDEESISLDANIWIDRDSQAEIDFGIKIPVETNADRLRIYVPYEIANDDIVDLWDKLRDMEIAHAIFDADINTEASASGQLVTIRYNDSHHPSVMACLPIRGGGVKGTFVLDSGSAGQGSAITLDLGRLLNGLDRKVTHLYFRFRIPFRTLSDALARTGSYRDALTSPFIGCNVNVFFKVNEARQLPPSTRQLLYQEKTKIKRVYLILVVDESWSVFSQVQPYRIRDLEHEIWGPYWHPAKVGLKGLIRKKPWFMVYQWEVPCGLGAGEGRTLLATLTKTKVNVFSLVFYLVIFLVMSLLAELAVRTLLPGVN